MTTGTTPERHMFDMNRDILGEVACFGNTHVNLVSRNQIYVFDAPAIRAKRAWPAKRESVPQQSGDHSDRSVRIIRVTSKKTHHQLLSNQLAYQFEQVRVLFTRFLPIHVHCRKPRPFPPSTALSSCIPLSPRQRLASISSYRSLLVRDIFVIILDNLPASKTLCKITSSNIPFLAHRDTAVTLTIHAVALGNTSRQCHAFG